MLGRQDRSVYERAIYNASFRQHITPKFGPHFMHAHGAIFRASEPVYRTFTERHSEPRSCVAELVERRSLAGVLSLSYALLAAEG